MVRYAVFTYGESFPTSYPTSPPDSITWDFSASGQRPFIANCSTSATDGPIVEPVCIPVHEFFLGPKCADLIAIA